MEVEKFERTVLTLVVSSTNGGGKIINDSIKSSCILHEWRWKKLETTVLNLVVSSTNGGEKIRKDSIKSSCMLHEWRWKNHKRQY